jgi:serine/threonine protein kinase/formylglycine-generating enzyme required for sulfatase activity
MPDLVGHTLGQYQILERLGRGATSIVYKAYQEKLDRYVAIKVLSPHFIEEESFLERFHQEARAVARLDHPNILPVYDFDRIGDTVFIVMKYVTGGTLRDLMTAPLPLSDVSELATQVGLALGYAHKMGVVHRDVKPSNILMADSHQALLTDFGLAKIVALGRHLTQSGVGVGTPDYMSPEQARGHAVDGRADLYSFGVMVYEMLAGQLPFEADSSMGVVVKHLTEPPRSLCEARPDVPWAVEQVIFKAMAKEPADRYPTTETMVVALARAMGASPPSLIDQPSTPLGGVIVRDRPVAVPDQPVTVFDQPVAAPDRSAIVPDRPVAPVRISRRTGLIGVAGLIVILIVLLAAVGALSPAPPITPTAAIALIKPTATSTPTRTPSPTVKPTLTPTIAATDTPTPEPAPPGMVQVAAGAFTMGGVNSQQNADETPPHVVALDAFFIDAVEVTNAQFARFVAGSGYQTDAERAGDQTTWRTFNTDDRQRFPVTHVSWTDATRYCAWVGKRLPTEAEWEKAARGTTKNIYPWGNSFNSAWANTFELGAGQPVAVATNSEAGPYGAFDMIGNVWEWVQDWYGGDYYVQSPAANPAGPASGIQKVIRGGSFKSRAEAATTSVRGKAGMDNRGDDIGFRCAK